MCGRRFARSDERKRRSDERKRHKKVHEKEAVRDAQRGHTQMAQNPEVAISPEIVSRATQGAELTIQLSEQTLDMGSTSDNSNNTTDNTLQ